MHFAKRNFIQNTYALVCFKYDFLKIIGKNKQTNKNHWNYRFRSFCLQKIFTI